MLIDPAAHYGWTEADLAMTKLFGTFPVSFYSAYQEFRPLPPGLRERFPIYNLYHCDGGGWIWGLIELYYPQATQIVDWFHTEKRLEKVAQEALSGESAQEWHERVRT